jgi:hypothetical protein
MQNCKAILLAGSRYIMAIEKGSNFTGINNSTAGSKMGERNPIKVENWGDFSPESSGWLYKSSAWGPM